MAEADILNANPSRNQNMPSYTLDPPEIVKTIAYPETFNNTKQHPKLRTALETRFMTKPTSNNEFSCLHRRPA